MFSAGKEACASLVAGTSNAGDVADKSPEKVEKGVGGFVGLRGTTTSISVPVRLELENGKVVG